MGKVKSFPPLDNIGAPILTAVFGALRRIVRNLVLSLPCHAVSRWLMLPIPLALADWAHIHHIGLLNWLTLPRWVALIATFLLMDYAYWWWHWANHMVPFFWRFHNVHHTDLDMDVSTAARFHFFEMILSTGFLALAVVLFGI